LKKNLLTRSISKHRSNAFKDFLCVEWGFGDFLNLCERLSSILITMSSGRSYSGKSSFFNEIFDRVIKKELL